MLRQGDVLRIDGMHQVTVDTIAQTIKEEHAFAGLFSFLCSYYRRDEYCAEQ
jgi:hypothetical protein